MKSFLTMLVLGILLMSLFTGIAYAASKWWVCDFCGRRTHAENMPGVQYCNKNPSGNIHRWRVMD